MVAHDAIVLAGGAGRRMGGVLKAQVKLRGRRLLDHVLDATTGARSVVVVAPDAVPVPAAVLRTLEDPPCGGPVAGIAAGLTAVKDPAPLVLVLACDVPGAAAAVPRLLAAAGALTDFADSTDSAASTVLAAGQTGENCAVGAGEVGDGGNCTDGENGAVHVNCASSESPRSRRRQLHTSQLATPRGAVGQTSGATGERRDGVVLRDPEGHDQWLLGLYATDALSARLARLAAAGDLRGCSMRHLVRDLALIAVPAGADATRDVDTWADLDSTGRE